MVAIAGHDMVGSETVRLMKELAKFRGRVSGC